MPEKLSLNPAVILRSEPQYYNTYVAFDHRGVRTEFLTEKEYRALAYIYSKPASVNEISKEAAMELGDCEKFLKRMIRLNYVQSNVDDVDVKRVQRARSELTHYSNFPLPFLSAPTSVDVFITDRCNLNCVHCFSRTEEKTAHELSTAELTSIFDQLENLGIFEVRINGGEPFLHSEIDDVLRNLKQRRFRKVILTNGTLLNEKEIELLRDSEIIPTVSLDDSEENEHDFFRGSDGSFSLTVKGLKLLREHGLQYGINCCLHKRNLGRISSIVDFAARCGAHRIAFLDFKPTRRLRDHPTLVPSYDEYQRSIIDLISAKHRFRRNIDVALDVFLRCRPLVESVQEARRGYVSCQAGRNRLSIDSDGSVYPCNLVLSDPRWNMGNTRNATISDIWFSERWMFFRGGTKISDLKECESCRSLRTCKDFYCRLLPYITNKDIFGPHPKCSPSNPGSAM